MIAAPHVVWMPGGVRTEIHVGAEQTAGALCLLVDEPPVGWSLAPHRHRDESETIHVARGELEMEIDGERTRVSTGQSIHVPRGVVHTSANVGGGIARRVVVFSPAGLERFFLEAGAPSPDADVDWRAVSAAAARHGWEVLARDT